MLLCKSSSDIITTPVQRAEQWEGPSRLHPLQEGGGDKTSPPAQEERADLWEGPAGSTHYNKKRQQEAETRFMFPEFRFNTPITLIFFLPSVSPL